MKSIKSGNWNDSTTWDNLTGTPEISLGHTVLLNSAATVNAQNIIVNGTWQKRPGAHLKYTGIIERDMTGGGMVPLPKDFGIWVVGTGKLDWQGTAKNSWSNAIGSVGKNSTSVTVKDATGWKVGDEIEINPTGKGARPDEEYEERRIASIAGNTIHFNEPLLFDHLQVKNWTPEVLNLTRDINIEGTPTGRTHILITSTAIQNIQYASFRHCGPRKDLNGDGVAELLLGRYAIHFHHCGWVKGTIVHGCVCRDNGNHAFVPHGSHGIKMTDNIAYNNIEMPFWYDFAHSTHELIWDRNIAVRTKYVSQSLAADVDVPVADMPPTLGASNFSIGLGFGNSCTRCVGVGSNGDEHASGDFIWPADSESGPWFFEDNLSHSSTQSMWNWDNSPIVHLIRKFFAYNCKLGLYHGAYVNNFNFQDCEYYNAPLEIRANSNSSYGQRYENITIDCPDSDYCIITSSANKEGFRPIVFRNVKFSGGIKGDVWVESQNIDGTIRLLKNMDFINCGQPRFVFNPNTWDNEVVRVQDGAAAFKITKAGKVSIPLFAPAVFGNGDGINAKYFDKNGVLVADRIDTALHFGAWNDRSGAYHTIVHDAFTAVWEFLLEPHHTEEHDLTIETNASSVLTIEGKTLNGEGTIKVFMEIGKKYPVKVTFAGTGHNGISLKWSSPSLQKFIAEEYIQKSQLYSGAAPTPIIFKNIAKSKDFTRNNCPAGSTGSVYTYGIAPGTYSSTISQADADSKADADITANGQNAANANGTCTVVPLPNQIPTANAGQDVTIVLPTNSIKLIGTGADAEGPVTFRWTKVTTLAGTILTPTAKDTTVSSLVAGVHTFRLTVTDNKGATKTDDVNVTVSPAPSPGQREFNIPDKAGVFATFVLVSGYLKLK